MAQIRIGVVQFAPRDSVNANLDAIRAAIAELGHCDLYVLPEYSTWHHPDPGTWGSAGDAVSGDVIAGLVQLASDTSSTIVAGALVEDGGSLRNRVHVVDASGVIATYDKVHLYDAFGAKESDVITAGDPSAPAVVVDVNGVRVGVQTCYDIRFPEVSRRLVDAGAEVLVVPADWVPGPNKVEQWTTLLRARAIENVAWVVAADHAAPTGVGHSLVIDPLGLVVAELGEQPQACAVSVDAESITDARRTNPALDLRRYRVVPR
ncbi:MAG: hypothetical protein RLZZ319_33 [Actinomycetota bacterium]